MRFSFLHYLSELLVQSDFRWLAYFTVKKIHVGDQSFECSNFLSVRLGFLFTISIFTFYQCWWFWVLFWLLVIFCPLLLLVLTILKIGFVGCIELHELLFCEENYPEQTLLEFFVLHTMLNVINSLLAFHKLSVDIISLLNRCQRLLLNILLNPLLSIRSGPLLLIVLIIYHQQDICQPKVIDKLLELLEEESVIFVGH